MGSRPVAATVHTPYTSGSEIRFIEPPSLMNRQLLAGKPRSTRDVAGSGQRVVTTLLRV
jgi:hypothetical protein